jgi:tRNA-2-methylthio-N6-dimethylallyladenosine synthase
VEEVTGLARVGVREVTLLGQNVNAWGRDLRPAPSSFSALLRALDPIDGIERIRYTSPHPKDMRADVIEAHTTLPTVCEHIHLPLQSGSSRVLKRMRRTYDRKRYLERVAMIRGRLPDCAITTDIIVGFPGETEDDFAETVEVAQEVGFDGAFTFVFSPRRGTEAAGMRELFIAPEISRERMDRLVAVVRRRAGERARRFVGRELEVMVEGTSRENPGQLRGRTRHNRNVYFEGLGEPGDLVPVTITAATSQSLTGEMSLAGMPQRLSR